MPKRRDLKQYEEFTGKEAALVDAYTNPKSVGYRSKLHSYRAAGYYEAAIPEGKEDDGRAARTAKVSADKLFRKPSIRGEIDRRFAKEFEALKMSVEETVARVSKIAGVDLMEYLVEVPHVCPECEAELGLGIEYVFDIKRMKRDGFGSLLKGMEPTKYGTKLSFYQADTALRDLMKHHGVFESNKKSSGINVFADLVQLAQIKQS